MNVLELSEQEIIRRNSMNELRAMGIEPYPAAEYVTNAFSTDIKAEFKDDAEPRKVSVAGRMMTRRVMGKASFIELQDSKGRIQVYITRDDICPGEDKDLYNTVFKRLLDLGDFIGIEGFVIRTQMCEISIHAQKLTVLANSIIVAKCYCLLFSIPHIFCILVSYPSSCMLQTFPSHTIFVVCFSPELLITTNFCASG